MEQNIFLKSKIIIAFVFISITSNSQQNDSLFLRKMYDFALTESSCYSNLRVLCKTVGHRLSGSENAEKAVLWGEKTMRELGFDTVYLQEVMVPHWVRGKESLTVKVKYAENSGGFQDILSGVSLNVTALGGSVGTDEKLEGELIEVKSFEELKSLGEKNIKGKIVFMNRPMDEKNIVTFKSYGGCVDQRASGASEAARYGAIGVIIRSVTQADDDHPHTGSLQYNDSLPKIPAAAVSTQIADQISQQMARGNKITAKLDLGCKTLKDVKSYNVIGELRGSENPKNIIVVGGHLDSWDKGEGAHDDGAGCVHSIEVLNILKKTGYKPKNTIRCVLYMNEENGVKGGKKYAEVAKVDGTTHIAAIESDRGGFTPLGFSADGTPEQIEKILTWKKLFEPYQVTQFEKGYSGVDVGKLKNGTTLLMGFIPDSQRYFDHHHADTDVFESVHKRELELGSAAMAAMVYLIDFYGIP
jgi:carboxypeptidase Q